MATNAKTEYTSLQMTLETKAMVHAVAAVTGKSIASTINELIMEAGVARLANDELIQSSYEMFKKLREIKNSNK
jgi:predicted DNA-binding protein